MEYKGDFVNHKNPSKLMVMCDVSYYGKSNLYWFTAEHTNKKGFIYIYTVIKNGKNRIFPELLKEVYILRRVK